MAKLPPDGTNVEAMTYESIEYDTLPRKVSGKLFTHWVESLQYTQCIVDGMQVDPDTVKEMVG